jgi:hypothetical protein
LFTLEKLTAADDLRRLASADFSPVLDAVRIEMLARYQARRQAILDKLKHLDAQLADLTHWWARQPDKVAGFRHFAANVGRNFGPDSAGHIRIADDAAWCQWRSRLLEGLTHYAADRTAWERLL